MARKPSLASALNEVANTKTEVKKESAKTEKQPIIKKEVSYNIPPSRQGKKAITGFFEPEVLKQLKRIGLDEDKTNQDLIAEALNDLFVKYNQKPIA